MWVKDLLDVCGKELRKTVSDVGVLVFFIVVPLLYPLLYAYLYGQEVVREVPVVAVDDCTDAVTTVPVNIPVKRLVVIAPSTWRSCGPAIFCRASLIDFIPNINRAREPRSLKIINIRRI